MNKQAYFVLIVSKEESGKALQDAHVSTKYVYHTADRYAGTYEYAVLLLWSTRYVLLLRQHMIQAPRTWYEVQPVDVDIGATLGNKQLHATSGIPYDVP